VQAAAALHCLKQLQGNQHVYILKACMRTWECCKWPANCVCVHNCITTFCCGLRYIARFIVQSVRALSHTRVQCTLITCFTEAELVVKGSPMQCVWIADGRLREAMKRCSLSMVSMLDNASSAVLLQVLVSLSHGMLQLYQRQAEHNGCTATMMTPSVTQVFTDYSCCVDATS
jgi:hypothetical protein